MEDQQPLDPNSIGGQIALGAPVDSAYKQGYNAHVQDTCPFPLGSYKRGDWNIGYMDRRAGRPADERNSRLGNGVIICHGERPSLSAKRKHVEYGTSTGSDQEPTYMPGYHSV
jgi:hypothetical protein